MNKQQRQMPTDRDTRRVVLWMITMAVFQTFIVTCFVLLVAR